MKNENKIFDPKFTEMIRIRANDIRVVEILYNVKIKQDLILNPKVHLNCFKNFLRIIELTSTGHLEKWVTSKKYHFWKLVIWKICHFGNEPIRKMCHFENYAFENESLRKSVTWEKWSISKWPISGSHPFSRPPREVTKLAK